MRLKELFDFEEIQDVIEIERIPDEKELVEKFVISPNLEEEIIDLLNILKDKKHKSANVIGNYGTGKSHLLAFLSLVLSNPNLARYVQSQKIKEKLSSLKREFVIVKYELPARQAFSVARIFFYRVRKQLHDNYEIEIRDIDPEKEDKDIKELFEEILNKIKEKYPTKGLLVIFDEFSDFLKQRQTEGRNYDLQFYRQLGECSNTMDFMFLASMQEYIFSNPKYVDQAESIARTQQRYKDIRITNESVEEIIAKRVVGKSQNQIMELRKEFSKIEHYFSNLAVEQDKYVRLFPVHPYVIDVFSILPFFEKRGIIQFLSKEIKDIMDSEFPQFITYDLIYDNMERVLAIKNHPDVSSVINAVETIKTKIDLLDAKVRPTASKLVKALAILNLIKSSTKNGATPQELANTLFIISSSKMLKPVDDIERILENLRKVSDGQFINKSKEGVYYLDLQKTQDYDVIIQNRITNMTDLKYINERFVENYLLNELDIEFDTEKIPFYDKSRKYVLDDTAYWEDRKSFRKGKLVIDIGYPLALEGKNDYVITIPGYTIKDTRVDSKNHIIVRMDYHDALVNSMKKLAAIEDFLRTRAYVVIMETKKRAVIDNELKPALAQALSKAEVTFQGKTLKIREDIGIITDVPAEIFNQIKQKLLNEQFTKEYPEYPKLKSRVSAENIRGTMESVLKDIMLKQGVVENLLTASGNILIPLGLYKGSRLDVAESQYAKVIMDKIEDTGKNVSIQELVKFFEGKPYGIHEELVYLILAVLLRNGDIMFSSKRGNTYSASDSNALFQNGLKAYDELSYVKKEEELNVSQVQMLFNALSEDISLLHAKKDRPEAYRRYIEKIEQIEKNIKDISADFERLKESVDIGIPTEQLNEQIAKLRDIDFSRLKIKSIVEFKKLDYSTEKIRLYREGYESIKRLKGFFDDYFEFIKDGVSYMKNAVELTQAEYFKKADAEKLSQIYNGAKEIIQTTKKLLKEDERRPLKGKVEEFKKKYKEIYYHTHNSIVGNQVDWQALYDIEHSETVAKMSLLKDIKCINPAKYTGTLLRVKTVEDTKCTEFKVDELDTNTSCPHCQFPAGDFEVNINSEIPKLGNEFEMILQSWEHQIIDEMRSNQDNVSNLDHDEKRLIQDILSKGYIPKELGEETITAINNLLEGLEVKEVDLVELQKILTEDADVLKVDEFREKIERYIEGILESGDTGNIRLRIKGLREK